ncbi:nicotinate phosphoribosyltransferase [Borealophlyctis nickersoniae]|nr:nicotinate phosphoribosyltransferase [Borealophlyctis nickersoniae]
MSSRTRTISLLDNDLVRILPYHTRCILLRLDQHFLQYKFSMQQAVLELYPTAEVSYRFKNRSSKTHKYTPEAFEVLKTRLADLAKVRLTPEEHKYLVDKCPFFGPKYISFLSEFRYKPESQIELSLTADNDISLSITGTWVETILYEVPVLALISEVYAECIDRDWDMEGQYQLARDKASKLIEGGCRFSDFGTRRRRNYETQDMVVKAMMEVQREAEKAAGDGVKFVGGFGGTSNVHFAMKYGLTPIGTVAHEWVMAVSVLELDLKHANRQAYTKWLQATKENFAVALTDTYGLPAFFADFDADLARAYKGVRHDSGDPLEFVDHVVQHYRSVGVPAQGKLMVFSDSLNVDRCLKIQSYVAEHGGGFVPIFGIGTFFTNDFKRKSNGKPSEPMNIVIKLHQCDGKFVVKLSEDKSKSQGDENAVRQALETFKLN